MLSSAVTDGLNVGDTNWNLPKQMPLKVWALSGLGLYAFLSLRDSKEKMESHSLQIRIKKILCSYKKTCSKEFSFSESVKQWKEGLLSKYSEDSEPYHMAERTAEIIASRYETNEKMLDLTNRSLCEIPFDLIEKMEKTTLLVLSGNPFGTLDGSFCKSNLQTFSAKHCSIEKIRYSFFSSLSSLTSLNLSENLIYEIPEGCFSSMENLRVLDLQKNKIQKVCEKTFKGLESLVYLQLASNQLNEFHDKALCHTPNLRELHLSNNKLTQFSLKSLEIPFQSEHPYHIVTLGGNPVTLKDESVDFKQARVSIHLDKEKIELGEKEKKCF